MKSIVITALLCLLKLASAADSSDPCKSLIPGNMRIELVVECFYNKAGTSLIDLENELSNWPKQCSAISPDTIHHAIMLQQDISSAANKADRNATSPRAIGYTVSELNKKADWITAMTVSFISVMKGWDIAHESVKAAGQEQAVLNGLRDLKVENDRFRSTIEHAIAVSPWSAVNAAYKEVWKQDHAVQQYALDRTIQGYGG